MMHNIDNYKHKLLRKLFNDSVYSCESFFIIIPYSIILYVKLYREKKHSRGNTARAQDQGPALLTVTNSLWLISISCYIYLTTARPIPVDIPWVCPALWTPFECSLNCPPWRFQEPSHLLGGFIHQGSALVAITLLPSLQPCLKKRLCAHCSKQSLRGSPSTNPATGWDRIIPSENSSWAIFKCTVRHKFLCQQTVQDKDEIFTFCFCSNPFLYAS